MPQLQPPKCQLHLAHQLALLGQLLPQTLPFDPQRLRFPARLFGDLAGLLGDVPAHLGVQTVILGTSAIVLAECARSLRCLPHVFGGCTRLLRDLALLLGRSSPLLVAMGAGCVGYWAPRVHARASMGDSCVAARNAPAPEQPVSEFHIHQSTDGAIRFDVHLQPRASDTAIVGTHGEALKVRVQAPPVDGAANDALVALLSRRLGVRSSDVRIVAGHTSRRKVVEVRGTTAERVVGLARA